ncbi:MAG: DNRLRE domain-containing protein, partial [Thermoguttaceae bacterium]
MESLENRCLLTIVTLNPVNDNTLIGELSGTQGATSNGAGDIFVGQNKDASRIRRGLLEFDVAGSVPAGATINSATLTMYATRTQVGNMNVELHKLLADWGEAGSSGGGDGAPAQTGDATWLHTFYANQFWATPGGDFSPTVSGVQAIGASGTAYTWSSTTAMVTDVQGWLNSPATNFGWLLKGVETQRSSKRFASSESSNVSRRPLLTIDYTVPAAPTLAIAATSASKSEGNAGSTAFTFTVTRTGSTTGTSTVNYAIAGSGANPAAAADFA